MKLLIAIIVSWFVISSESAVNFDVFARSLKYSANKTWVKDFKGEIKPRRNKPGGVINHEVTLIKQLDEVFFSFRLLYRYGTIYRPYLFDYKKIEVCELFKKQRSIKYSNPIADLFLAGFKQCCSNFYHECPFMPSYYGGKEIDVNATVAPYLPPVVAAGYYKVEARLFTTDNVTLGEIVGIGQVKANHKNRATDFSMLNMG